MPEGMDELEAIFPNLREMVSNWKASGSPGVDPSVANEHGGVTDADVEAYFASRPGFRAPLPSSVPTLPVQFAPGQTAPPPPPAHVEGQAPSAQSPAPVVAPPADGGTGGGDVGPEGIQAPLEPTPLPDQVVIGDRAIPRERVQGLAALDDLLQGDPQLRQLVAQYMTTGQVVAPPQTYPSQQVAVSEGLPSPVAAPPQGGGPASPSWAAPNFTPAPPPEDIADDPVLSSLWNNQQRIEAGLAAMAQNQQAMVQQQAAAQQADFNAVTNAAISKFQTDMELTEEQTRRVVDVANSLNIVNSFLTGVDPVTGLPLRPDPFQAVVRTMETAYNLVPEFQSREFERRQRQHVEDQARKAKLSAVGGGGPPAPRSQPAPTNPQERSAALHQEVSQMLAGSWAPPNQQ